MSSSIRPPAEGNGASSPQQRPNQLPPFRGGGDPWAAFGYLVSGVAVYGVIGWALGYWLHAPFLTAVGIVVGAVLGLYLVFNRFGRGQLPPVADGRGSRARPETDAGHREERGEPPQ